MMREELGPWLYESMPAEASALHTLLPAWDHG